MQIDNITLYDLGIFSKEEDASILKLLNQAQTTQGRLHIKTILSTPYKSIEAVNDAQLMYKHLLQVHNKFITAITNGTIMVVEKYFETPVNAYPKQPSALSALLYKITNGADYAITKYSIKHCYYLCKGIFQSVQILQGSNSQLLNNLVNQMQQLLKKEIIQQLLAEEKIDQLPAHKILHYAYDIKYKLKSDLLQMCSLYATVDAYMGLAVACQQQKFSFPTIQHNHANAPVIEAQQMFHPLLPTPVAYDVQFNSQQNFMFLTGANMAGKSTFIKALGVSVYLAHLGLPVPAKQLELSFFNGLLSNIQITDNVAKGESFFYNEVQRIKTTVQKINDGLHWLVLIDELFKGTNMQDAMKCSTAVIKGLLKLKQSAFVVSTHLYEIANNFSDYNNMQFKYFETQVANNRLQFSYNLNNGVSTDRLGYLILQQEGVEELLDKL